MHPLRCLELIQAILLQQQVLILVSFYTFYSGLTAGINDLQKSVIHLKTNSLERFGFVCTLPGAARLPASMTTPARRI